MKKVKFYIVSFIFSLSMFSTVLAVAAIEHDGVSGLQGFLWALASMGVMALTIKPLNNSVDNVGYELGRE